MMGSVIPMISRASPVTEVARIGDLMRGLLLGLGIDSQRSMLMRKGMCSCVKVGHYVGVVNYNGYVGRPWFFRIRLYFDGGLGMCSWWMALFTN